ncbi:MAG TPA: PIN domain-containing protein [Acidimicrobiales bacterium]|nr:PIN domain-containing protein [Acidimicrobiales bacterium]
MFVEIVRLIIVILATAAGFALGKGAGGGPEATSHGAIIGATLGACVGYVVGGVFGRLLRQAMGTVERKIDDQPPHRLLAGALGGTVAGGLFAVIGVPAVLILPGRVGGPIMALTVWAGAYHGYQWGARKSEGLLAMAGLSTRPLVRATPYSAHTESDALLVDTSALLDGRLIPLARSGFLQGALLVPPFVLDELQGIADAQDPTRRRRGRRALELLDALRQMTGVEVHVLDDEVPEHVEVDAKLVALAKRLRVGLITLDEPLQRVAELQGIRCLSPQRLSDGLRPAHVSGDVLQIGIARDGKEPGQGVGFLDDGTMVVVSDAASYVGKEVEVRVNSSVQTSVGPMLFATLASPS